MKILPGMAVGAAGGLAGAFAMSMIILAGKQLGMVRKPIPHHIEEQVEKKREHRIRPRRSRKRPWHRPALRLTPHPKHEPEGTVIRRVFLHLVYGLTLALVSEQLSERYTRA